MEQRPRCHSVHDRTRPFGQSGVPVGRSSHADLQGGSRICRSGCAGHRRAGPFRPHLRKEDFRIFEDGKPQTIASFALVEIPREGERLPAPNRTCKATSSPFVGAYTRSILDNLHTAALRAPLVKAAARQFILRQLAANDLMAVVHTAGRDEASQDFTSNKRLLLAAVDRFMGMKLESATMARNEEFFRGAGRRRCTVERSVRQPNAASTRDRPLGRSGQWRSGWAASAAVARRFSSSAKGLTTTSPIRSTTVRRQRSWTRCAARSPRRHVRT